MIKILDGTQQKGHSEVVPPTRTNMNQSEFKLRKRIKWVIAIFVFFLILSGVTAFPVETELKWALQHLTWLPQSLFEYLQTVSNAVGETNANYPFIAYGFDWLAFAHIVIGIAFIGPYRDPVRNIWIIEWAMICCVAIIPLAFICGPIREIPLYWTFIDCSFGVFGIIPLWYCRALIKRLEQITAGF
ncbi:MAG: hypothetical protein ACKVOK_14225 [Flavobacteriales bacterium]